LPAILKILASHFLPAILASHSVTAIASHSEKTVLFSTLFLYV